MQVEFICAAGPGRWPGRAVRRRRPLRHHGHPHSGCALGALVPPGRHGAWKVIITAAQAAAPVFTTAAQAASRLAPHGRVQPRAAACAACCGSSACAMPAGRHSRPSAHTLRAFVRAASVASAAPHARSIVQARAAQCPRGCRRCPARGARVAAQPQLLHWRRLRWPVAACQRPIRARD
jgi:hypothetical protein